MDSADVFECGPEQNIAVNASVSARLCRNLSNVGFRIVACCAKKEPSRSIKQCYKQDVESNNHIISKMTGIKNYHLKNGMGECEGLPIVPKKVHQMKQEEVENDKQKRTGENKANLLMIPRNSLTIREVPTKYWMKVNEIPLPSFPFSLRVINDTLWYISAEGIKVFDRNLQQQSPISMDKMSTVYDVLSNEEGDLVIATLKGLYYGYSDGDRVRQIDEGVFFSLSTGNNHIYATEMLTRECRTYQASPPWEKVNSFKVPCIHRARFTTLGVMNNDILVFCADCGYLKVMSPDGKTLVVSSRKRKKQKKTAHLSCSFLGQQDSSGSLIAEGAKNQLQVLDNYEGRHIVHLQDNIKDNLYPKYAILWKYQLIICSMTITEHKLLAYI